MISFSIQEQQTDQFAYRLGNLRDLARRGLVDPSLGTLSVQAKLLLEKCIQLTPFFDLAQARRRINSDTARIFRPLDPADFKNPRIAQIVRTGSSQDWDALASRLSGKLQFSRAVLPTRELHKQALDSRGRPRRTNYVTIRRQSPALAEVRRAALDRAGWARAGWLHGYLQLGGIRVPDWVRRHYPLAPGQFDDGRFDRLFPSISARNTTKFFTQRKDSETIMRAAVNSRISAMRSYFNAQMGLVAQGRLTSFQSQQQAIAAQFGF